MTGRFVHLAGRCAPAALAVYAGANLAAIVGIESPLLLAALSLAMIVVCISWWVHSRSMCEWCVGYVPVDSDAEVNRHRGSLHWCHHPRRRQITLVTTAGMLSAPLMPTPGLAAAVIAVFAFVCSIELRCESLHRDLMPWCPWCRGGGETDETWTPDPTLAGAR